VKRRLFNLLAGVSLLMCLAMVGLCVRTFWRCDDIGGRQFGLATGQHQLLIRFVNRPYFPPTIFLSEPLEDDRFGNHAGPFIGFTKKPVPDGTSYSALWFVYLHFRRPPFPAQFAFISIPWWILIATTAVLPIIWLKRRCAPRIPGLCPACGYDLRATPERCPECGTVKPAASR
jgi:hypothetical protein